MHHRMHLAAALATLVVGASLTVLPAQASPSATRAITITAVEPRAGVFVVKGKVDPAYPDRVASLQRKLRRDSEWSRWRKFRTGEASHYRRHIQPLRRPGVVCYRVRIRASNGFDESFSPKVCLRSFRA